MYRHSSDMCHIMQQPCCCVTKCMPHTASKLGTTQVVNLMLHGLHVFSHSNKLPKHLWMSPTSIMLLQELHNVCKTGVPYSLLCSTLQQCCNCSTSSVALDHAGGNGLQYVRGTRIHTKDSKTNNNSVRAYWKSHNLYLTMYHMHVQQ